jgi:hypothetical protein
MEATTTPTNTTIEIADHLRFWADRLRGEQLSDPGPGSALLGTSIAARTADGRDIIHAHVDRSDTVWADVLAGVDVDGEDVIDTVQIGTMPGLFFECATKAHRARRHRA